MTGKIGKTGILPGTVFAAALAFLLVSTAKTEAVDYNWSALLKNNDTWFANAEARAIGDSIVKYQLSDGGWRKAMDDVSQTGEWAKSTVDNDATTSQIHFLARLYRQTNTAKYLTSCQKGIDLFLTKQYSNGGWPQVFGASSTSYHVHITYNDGAMVKILELLKAVSEKSGNFTFIDNDRAAKAKTAVDKGVECILNTQIVFTNGEKTAWCQQHNSSTLAPAGARAYELPSVSGSESVGIVNFLKSYHNSLGNNPRLDIVLAVNAAVTWMGKVKIVGKKVENITTDGAADRRVVDDPNSTIWARFYELQTNRPIFVGRDGVIKYALADIEQERRAGYAYYGNWPNSLVNAGLLPEPSVNTPPAASITAPANNSTSMPGQTINITAAATDADGAVTKVEFFNGTTKLGEKTSSPWTYAWANPPSGTHIITARATDNGGATTTSAAVTVRVPTLIGSGSLVDSVILFDRADTAAWKLNTGLGPGTKVYVDRAFVTGSVPAVLQSAEWISTSMGTRTLTTPSTLAQFRAKKKIDVYLLHEDRVATKPAWIASSGFAATAQKMTVNDGNADRTFTLYTKTVNQGDMVTLGTNSNDGTTSTLMYLAAFVEQATASALNRTPPANNSLKISHGGNGGTISVNYSIKDNGAVRLDLFDIKGNRVRTLINTTKNAGAYGERISTGGLAAGAYVVKLKAGALSLQERVLIAK